MRPGAELLYLHPQPGGIGYRHWLSVLARHPDPTRQIAPAVATFRERRAGGAAWRMLAGGFDMDNMKARGFAESEIPVFEPADLDAAAAKDELVSGLVRAADLVARLLSRCVGRALFGDGATVDPESALLASVRERFWDATANDFFEAARTAADGGDPAAVRGAWRAAIDATATRLFAEAAPMDASGEGHPARIAAAARQLSFALRGYGKDGASIFAALALEAPPAAAKTRKGKAA
jgi:CRISPR system Cascade subunit CasA